MAWLGASFIRNILITLIPLVIIWNLSDASSKRLCGKELSITLEFICENSYNGFRKKSVGTGDRDYTDQYIDDDIFYPFNQLPDLSKVHKGALFPKIRRLRQGVADECCKKPCTYAELSSYCKYPRSQQ